MQSERLLFAAKGTGCGPAPSVAQATWNDLS